MNYLDKREELCNLLVKLHKEKKDTFEVKQQISLTHIQEAEDLPYVTEAKVVSAHNSCDICKAHSTKTYTLEEVKTLKLVPSINCTRSGGCRCRYIFTPIRNDDGSFKRK